MKPIISMPLHIDILTLFPRMLDGFLAESILGKGVEGGLLSVKVHDLRDWATDKHKRADDRPFGGGAGMVLKPEPVFAAIEQLQTTRLPAHLPDARRRAAEPRRWPGSSPGSNILSCSAAITRASTSASATA